MPTFNWSTLTNGQTLTFNAASDVLNFDDPTVSATSLGYSFTASNSGNFSFSLAGKTVTLTMPYASITTANVKFANGSQYLVGDNTTAVGNGTLNDDAANTLNGTANDDAFAGLGGNDVLNGGDGNDVFNMAFSTSLFGNDTINGGNGTDTVVYITNSTNAIVANLAAHTSNNAQGNQTLSSIEVIYGTAGADQFTGGDVTHASNSNALGNADIERFRGNAGNDTITGGADFFVSGQRVVYFTVADYANNSSAQAINVNLSLATNNATDGRGGTDTLVNVDGVRGGDGSDTLLGGSQSRAQNGFFFEFFRGNAGNDIINGNNVGTGGDDSSSDRVDYSNNGTTQGITVTMTGAYAGTVIDGLGGTDTLTSIDAIYGGAGADVFNAHATGRVEFDGGAGNDTFNGAAGSDAVSYRQSTSGVIVNLSAASVTFNAITVAAHSANDGMGGTDTLTSIEGVQVSDFDDYIRGSDDVSVVESFAGRGGNDTIDGGAGVDYVSYSRNALALGGITATISNGSGTINDGQGGTDTVTNIEGISGTQANDTLTGGSGTQWLRGNGGSDTLNGGADDDWVSYAFDPSGVNVDLTTGLATDGFNGAGGLLGLGGTDTLISIENVEGSNYNDVITGNGFANVLAGGAGDDTLNGGLGADTMIGGLDNDTYYVDNAGDVVIEAAGEGTLDIVNTTLNYYSIAGIAGIENLVFQGAGAFTAFGNYTSNTIQGGSGADTLWSSYGADGFADALIGGGGNDTYVVYESTDTVTETDANPVTGGSDLVYTGANFTLGANVEYLYALGGATITALTGNTLDNVISAINYYGGSGMTIDAGDGNDTVYGSYYADTILGGNGADTLWGSWGADNAADAMNGGAGSDTYVVQEALDTVIETDATAAGGLDLVYSGISYTLGANVEYLQIYGSATTGTGNALGNLIAASYSGVSTQLFGLGGADQLVGGGGNDRLDGGSGADVLIGSTGNDTFVFVAGEANGDVITDFNGNGAAAGDSLELSGYGAGATFTNIDATHWQVNYGAGLASHDIITFSNSAVINAQDVLFV
jgi:Ca2+-binding RTX toxin-like protein